MWGARGALPVFETTTSYPIERRASSFMRQAGTKRINFEAPAKRFKPRHRAKLERDSASKT
jgi:hypothetical protein